MKTHEIRTSKGEFVVVHLSTNAKPIICCGRCFKPDNDDEECWSAKDCSRGNDYNDIITIDSNKSWSVEGNSIKLPIGIRKIICKLSEATEEDAKGVVDEKFFGGIHEGYEKEYAYMNYNIGVCNMSFTAIDSLHSLLKSKGIDINNGNWYLFKKA